MLQELVVMVKAAEKVMMGGEDESRPTFGHLIILMRDVDGKVDEVEKLVLGREDTKNLKLKQKKDPMERNMIREGLKDAFESIAFHTMPAPHPRISGNACTAPRYALPAALCALASAASSSGDSLAVSDKDNNTYKQGYRFATAGPWETNVSHQHQAHETVFK